MCKGAVIQLVRKRYVSLLNVLACFSVVMLHANGIFWSHPKGRLWISSLFIETFFYWAVPVFFMLSGVTLLDYRDKYTTLEYAKKRIRRTLIPFMAWSFFGMLFRQFYSNMNVDWSFTGIVSGMITSRYIDIYWFFMPLFAVYMCIPALGAVPCNTRLRVFKPLCWLGVIFVVVLPFICTLLKIDYNRDLVPPVVCGYMVYLLAGYCLDKSQLKLSVRLIIYFFGILGWAAHFWGTHVLSYGQSYIDGTFKGYLNLPGFMHSVAVFVFVKQITASHWLDKVPYLYSFFDRLSGLTFGIYLIHFYFVIAVPGLLHIKTASMLYRTFGAVGIFALSAIITFCLKKIPLLKHIV